MARRSSPFPPEKSQRWLLMALCRPSTLCTLRRTTTVVTLHTRQVSLDFSIPIQS